MGTLPTMEAPQTKILKPSSECCSSREALPSSSKDQEPMRFYLTRHDGQLEVMHCSQSPTPSVCECNGSGSVPTF